MPTFRNNLPTSARTENLKLRRVPPRGPLQAIILSTELTVVDTHYWRGRTCPCERELNPEGFTIDDSNCEACQHKQGYRPHVYVACWDPRAEIRFLLEITPHAAKPLADYIADRGTLRGCSIYATRPKGKENAAVTITTAPVNQSITRLPNPPDVPAALAILWRLPRNCMDPAAAVCREIDERSKEPVHVQQARPNPAAAHRLQNQPDNATDPPTIGAIIAGNGNHR
jgi:hypothetical protein